ncbi:MAG TPA: NADH-quinone oxidoreductase subunit L [Acidimicrobiales bacterium]|nr:NADH-quinone oxidoreductase subunit L [Acidimicrobiales bacterium]
MIHAVWLIPALPLAGFLILLAFGRRLGDPKAGYLATAMMFGAFLVAVGVFFDLMGRHGEERVFDQNLFTWISAGRLDVHVGFLVDPLSVTMALFVTGVGALIHLYSVGYMHGDERYPTFFVYLNLFAFSMLMLVLSDSFLLTFLGWEGVGACSYFLISFWFERPTAATAGKKAFVTNRVGDFGFMLAMFLIFLTFGSLNYIPVLEGAHDLAKGTATAIALLLFVGAVGKSAQLPLYVWLPDAMEGPTPVSALIHAATMVTAGVFLMVRVNPILDMAPGALTLIAVIGALTAFFAATIACAQNDIKKVLAYSTVSQLGYMFLAVGSGAYIAAIFHMVTHAFFKALLFLGAGSVIHGMHDEQDMKRMGALRKWLPITSGTFIVGWLAIAGVPPFSGFWSKDDILLAAWEKNRALWLVGLITALMTAYYMSRQVFLVFYGGERWKQADARSEGAAAAEPEHEPAAAGGGHGDTVAGAHGAGAHGEFKPHESPGTMTFPLIALAVLAAVAGILKSPLDHWLETVLAHPHHFASSSSTKLGLAVVAIASAVTGILLARAIWLRGKKARQDSLEPETLKHAWYVDELYQKIIEAPGRALANFSAFVVDAKIIDGTVNGVGALVRAGGSRLRGVQSGFVRSYALAVAVGAVAILAYAVARTS